MKIGQENSITIIEPQSATLVTLKNNSDSLKHQFRSKAHLKE
jgi:hypothetical protein